MNYFDLQFKQLMAYGVHLGHSFFNTKIGMAWIVHAFRQTISIINLWKSIYVLKLTFFFVSNIIAFFGPIWFVNFSLLADRYIKFCAASCGELAVTSKWLRGAVSNFWATFKTYRLIAQIPEVILSPKYVKFKSFLTNWHFSRFSWPRALFFSNLENAEFAAKETNALKIPSFGIVDTNSFSQLVSLPVPGNDESILCLILYNDLMSNYIMTRKFSAVLMWFLNLRVSSRIVDFFDWIKLAYVTTAKDTFNPFKAFNYTNTSINNILYKGVSIFLSKNSGSNVAFERLDIFSNETVITNFSSIIDFCLVRKVILNKTLKLNFVKKMISLKRTVIKKKFLRDAFFKIKFLRRKFRIFKYLRGFYTLGKFKRFKIKIKHFLFKRRDSFLNILSDMFFLNKYENYILPRYFRKSKIISSGLFNYFSDIVKIVVSRYSLLKNTFFNKFDSNRFVDTNWITRKKNIKYSKFVFKFNKSFKNNYKYTSNSSPSSNYLAYSPYFSVDFFNKKKMLHNSKRKNPSKYKLIKNLMTSNYPKYSKYYKYYSFFYLWLRTKLKTKKMANIIFSKKLEKRRRQVKFFIKKLPTSKYKLKFFSSNFSFNTFINYNLIWNLRRLIFSPIKLSRYFFTFHFFGFFRRKVMENLPIFFESFLTKKLRKYFSIVRYKNLIVWMWR